MEIYKSEKTLENKKKEKFTLKVSIIVQDDSEVTDEQKQSLRELREMIYDIENGIGLEQ